MRRYWREAVLVAATLTALAVALALEPIAQDPAYHNFADQRRVFGIPNFANVASNLPFMVVGAAGLAFCLGSRPTGTHVPWIVFFAGVALVGVGSAYYHAQPTDAALVWDRLPMTVAFMGLFVALLAEHMGAWITRYLLPPALAIGLASIGWWRYADDLRFYAWVQFTPLLLIPLAVVLFRPAYTHRAYLLYGLGFYVLAKVGEFYDRELFDLTRGTLSGHSIKHLLAAGGALSIYLMLRNREPKR